VTPFHGFRVKGMPVYTIVRGDPAFPAPMSITRSVRSASIRL
jgi:dihydroorotase-like cyclic amidohydrolase